MRKRRLRKWAKWTCTLAAGAAVALAVVSRFYWCQRASAIRHGAAARYVTVAGGQVWVWEFEGAQLATNARGAEWHIERSTQWHWGLSGDGSPSGTEWDWNGGVMHKTYQFGRGYGVSLAYPVLATVIPAALLWYADRRRFRPGSCGGCGYDRAGLAVGVKCPECGMVRVS